MLVGGVYVDDIRCWWWYWGVVAGGLRVGSAGMAVLGVAARPRPPLWVPVFTGTTPFQARGRLPRAGVAWLAARAPRPLGPRSESGKTR